MGVNSTVTNQGTFNALSAGTMGNNGAANNWTFTNNATANLVMRAAAAIQFPGGNLQQRGNLFRRVAGGGRPNTSEFVGTVTQDQAGALTQNESGTLLVTGTFSQTKGDLTIMADTSLTVTSDFTESADANFNIELTTPQTGSGLATVGGTVTLNGSTLNITALPGFSGNQFTLISNTGGSSVVGTFAGLADGATLTVGGRVFAITYQGGAGNDVVLNWVNQAPSGTDNAISMTVNTTYTFNASNFGFIDSDGNKLKAIIITNLPTVGTFLLNGDAVTLNQVIKASDIPYLTYTPPKDQTGIALDSFGFKVQDDGGTAYGGIDTSLVANTLTINVYS